MRAAILIIGSLVWRTSEQQRVVWRRQRLDMDGKLSVGAPIYYGRLSQSNTYTMTFGGPDGAGRAVVVPCRAPIDDLEGLVAEARALWAAEFSKAEPETIGARRGWGCVGVAFRREAAGRLAARWGTWFRDSQTLPVAPVDAAGVVRVPWPREAEGSDIDILLATATEPERQRPTPREMAGAWMVNGGEEYFFRNVEHGIRTPDDHAIFGGDASGAGRVPGEGRLGAGNRDATVRGGKSGGLMAGSGLGGAVRGGPARPEG